MLNSTEQELGDTVNSEHWFVFGPFRYDAYRGVLNEGGRSIILGRYEAILLTALLECPGDIVSRETLLQRMWPDQHGEDYNLRWQVSSLRRRLRCLPGHRLIVAITGRGYRFISRVKRVVPDTLQPAEAGDAARPKLAEGCETSRISLLNHISSIVQRTPFEVRADFASQDGDRQKRAGKAIAKLIADEVCLP